jgi:glycosyltransferase involved in cell wall biosynthesis
VGAPAEAVAVKLLVLTTCYPRRSQPNAGIFIHRQVRALADLGIRCEVVQPVDWAPPAPLHRLRAGWAAARREHRDMLAEVDGVAVHHPRVYHPIPGRLFPGDYWTRVGHAVSAYVGRRPELRAADAIYAHFLCHEGYAGLVASRRLGMPLVAIARGDDVHAWPVRWPDRRAKLAAVLRHADGLLACSHALAGDAAAWARDGLGAPIEVVYNGVDGTRFSPIASAADRSRARAAFGVPAGRRLVLCVAAPEVAKGWLDLLDAFASIAAVTADWDLVMAGSIRSRDGLDLAAEALRRGLGSRVHWLGALAPDRMPDLYRAVDAFVLASHNEGLANVVLEAMASGLPVVVTDVGGHAEVVTDRVTGRLVPARDVDALAAALTQILTDERAAGAMGRAARERAVSVGDHQASARTLCAVLARLPRRTTAAHVPRTVSPSDQCAGSSAS